MNEKVTSFSGAPLVTEWCECGGGCPYTAKKCGAREYLSGFSSLKTRRAEAERLWVLAQTDPQRFFEICARSLFG